MANNTTQYGQFDNTWTLDQVQWGFEISGRWSDAGIHKQQLLGLVELVTFRAAWGEERSRPASNGRNGRLTKVVATNQLACRISPTH